MAASTAIVTLAVGRSFRTRWHAVCRDNWQRYADRHGYDVICIEDPLDTSERAQRRSPAWQKCLILGQDFSARYERLVWMDADVLLNPAAPGIVDGVPLDRVGVVDEFGCPTPELHRQTIRKLYRFWEARGIPFIRNETARDYYAVYGLPPDFDHVVQTGVMVLSPRHHRALLEHTYHAHEQRPDGLWNYEMRPLSWELLKAGVVHWLDSRFNYIWGSYQALHFPYLLAEPEHPRLADALMRAMREVYGLHFAGSVGDMARVDQAALAAADDGSAARAGSVVDDGSLPGRARLPEDAASERAAAGAAAPARGASGGRAPGLRTPVALMLFARPDTTREVFAAIRRARPATLLVVADGPRDDRPGEAERCAHARAVIDGVDWACDVRTCFADANLGLRRRIVTGLDWVFDAVDEAIVLEDDCVPHPAFFPFCEALLARYRDDARVMTVSGDNFQFGQRRGAGDYYFSRYPHIWGWATWRRAWRLYDADLASWPARRDSGWLDDLLGDPQAVQYWTYLFEQAHGGSDTWDYSLAFTAWTHGLLNALPNVNLVSNIGFRADATHTAHQERSLFANLPVEAIDLPPAPPAAVARDAEADRATEEVMFSGNLRRLLTHVRRRHRSRQRT